MKKNCFTCDFLRSKMKFDSERYFCRFCGCIRDPEGKVCGDWKEDEGSGREATIRDYIKSEK